MGRPFILSLIIGLSACGEPSKPDDLETEKDRFDSNSYVFTYKSKGFAPPGQWRIYVEEGDVVSVQQLGKRDSALPMALETAPTIRSLLDRIQACRSSVYCEITELEYDDNYHYPKVYFSSSGEEGSGFEITYFSEGDDNSGN